MSIFLVIILRASAILPAIALARWSFHSDPPAENLILVIASSVLSASAWTLSDLELEDFSK